ncbi:RNA chaperone Hfq [Swingsia samuiensis]|uniref:RNA-binding protein Hfq n=1 Tax=Swingsia samuiensis TaxID=1293412 RepID=A0A4Y6UKB5_9PROT|nr:RNA chaperone Hfq [Swingsia samuiensis]QDH18033.1 RNA chaperone Hfq [Swingsia samuiensis]
MAIQEAFLQHLYEQEMSVTVFLVNGVKLQGVVAQFDQHTLLLRRDGHVQLVYKHAVSTIMPAGMLPRLLDSAS